MRRSAEPACRSVSTGRSRSCPSGESFIAGTASCRVRVQGVDVLYAELAGSDVLHRVSENGVQTTDFGTREFAGVNLDGNLIAFFQWVSDQWMSGQWMSGQ